METTDKLGLRLPAETDFADVADINYNSAILDAEVSKRIRSVNGIEPGTDGSVTLNEVPFARQIVTDDAQQSTGKYTFRTTGGDASLQDGDAQLLFMYGRRVHTGYASESITMDVTLATRDEGETPIEATIDRDTFVAYVPASGTTVLTYTNAWSANPSLYGVTVTGTPVAGDKITIVYVKEERGTITVSNPSAFISTGWNLYDNTLGYAHVKRYSESWGFMVGGTYTALQYSATLNGSKTPITPVSGRFTVPGDGYVWVTGGDSTTTYILMTWSDWTAGYQGDFMAYSESTINLSGPMANFPDGLMQVGGISDEIDFGMGVATSRITRLAYNAQNLATVKASGRDYEVDENYIYTVREEPVTYAFTLANTYAAYDHGMEVVQGGTVAPMIRTLYGNNLVDKLRTDVVTISSQSLTTAQQKQVRKNIGATTDADLAIIANGNTHAAIASGQFVYVRNHSTLAEGLYKATAAIGTNAALSTSNLAADSSGGLNDLQGQVATLNSNLSYTTAVLQTSKGTLENWSRVDKSGNIVTVTMKMTMTAAVNAWNEIATIPSGFRPHTSLNFNVAMQNGSTLKFDQLQILDTGAIRIASNLASGAVFGFTVSYAQ